MSSKPYGVLDASYQAAGGEAGLRQLAADFYTIMRALPQAQHILQMHPQDLAVSEEKLALFLCGWTGGPALFKEKWQPVPIPTAHKHLAIGPAERDAWMDCMRAAVAKQDWADDFKEYFLEQIYKPARILRNRDE